MYLASWITVYATIETEYDEDNIVISTVILDDAVYAESGEFRMTGASW